MVLRHSVALTWILVTWAFPSAIFGQQEPGPVIKVRIYDQAGAGSPVIEKAQRRVSFVFKQVGITAQWVADEHPRFRILVVQNIDARFAEDMFGYTPRDADGTSSGVVYVRYGAINAFARLTEPGRPRLNVSDVLAYCMAHEIGHLLLPAGFHSPTGIMSARWRENDFKLMATGGLVFSEEEGRRMREAAARRAHVD